MNALELQRAEKKILRPPPKPAPEVAPRLCPCGQPMARRPKETARQFADRGHCSNPCASKTRLKTKQANEAARLAGAGPTRLCPCGQPIVRKSNEGVKQVEARRYCSNSCGAEAQWKREAEAKAAEAQRLAALPPRLCPCGQPIVRAEGERWEAYVGRGHCSEACAPPKPRADPETYHRPRATPATWQPPPKDAAPPSASVAMIRGQIVAMLGARHLSLESVRRAIVEVDGSASGDFTEALLSLVTSGTVERFTFAGWARLRLVSDVR